MPSAALLAALPDLVANQELLQYVLPRRWVFPDVGHYIDEIPWSQDWHVRLVRNCRAALRFAGSLHTNISGVEPLRYVDVPFYHLACVITSQEEREARSAFYETARPGRQTMPGWSVNNHYLPERFQHQPSAVVAAADLAVLRRVLDPADLRASEARRSDQARRSDHVSEVPVVPLNAD